MTIEFTFTIGRDYYWEVVGVFYRNGVKHEISGRAYFPFIALRNALQDGMAVGWLKDGNG
jgi:hypothetical protein